MREEILITCAFVFAVLLAGTVVALPSVYGQTEYSLSNCVCNHYDNEAYLGTIYDMMTGSAITGHYYTQNNYFSTLDQYYTSGYGSNANKQYIYPAVPPLNCYSYINTEGYGNVYDYSTNYGWNDPVFEGTIWLRLLFKQ